MKTINLKFFTGCAASLTLLCSFALCGCSGAENDISALECFAGSCDEEDDEKDHDHNQNNSYDYNYSSNYDDFFHYSSSEGSSDSKEIPQDCDIYAFGDAAQFECSAKNQGETMFNEYSRAIYSCEYVEMFGLYSWVEHAGLESCKDYEKQKNSGSGNGSSSSVSSSSSLSYLLSDSSPVACGNLWCGPDGDITVNTGFDDGSHTSGAWSIFDDSTIGGTSYISFPTMQANGRSYLVADILDECNGGICGIAHFGDSGSNIPSTGLYFNLLNDDRDGVDITSWGGLCITYRASEEIFLTIELIAEGSSPTALDADKYVAELDPEETMANIPWSIFDQERSSRNYPIQQNLFLTDVATIKIVMKGPLGQSGAFRITSIGKYGSCK